MDTQDFDLYTNQVNAENAARREHVSTYRVPLRQLCRDLDRQHWQAQQARWRREQRRWEILRVTAWVIAAVSLVVAGYVGIIMQ